MTEAPGLFSGEPTIEPGTYSVEWFGAPVEVTIPDGWTRHDDFWLEGPNASYLEFLNVTDTYLDACNWLAGKAEIGPSVDDLVAGLQAEKGLLTTAPQPLNVDGFTGTEIGVSAPADLDFATCYTGTFAFYQFDNRMQITAAKPGDTKKLWILDMNGQRGVITFGAWEPMSDATKAQLDEIADSITIG